MQTLLTPYISIGNKNPKSGHHDAPHMPDIAVKEIHYLYCSSNEASGGSLLVEV